MDRLPIFANVVSLFRSASVSVIDSLHNRSSSSHCRKSILSSNNNASSHDNNNAVTDSNLPSTGDVDIFPSLDSFDIRASAFMKVCKVCGDKVSRYSFPLALGSPSSHPNSSTVTGSPHASASMSGSGSVSLRSSATKLVQVVPINADIEGTGRGEPGPNETDRAETHQLLQEIPYNNIILKPSIERQQPPAGGAGKGIFTEHTTRTVVVEFDSQVEEVNCRQSDEVDMNNAYSNVQ